MENEAVQRLDERISGVEKVAAAADQRTQQMLIGFPQEYVTRQDAQREGDRLQHIADELRLDLIRIRTDHVSVETFKGLERQVNQATGARTTIVATAGIIVTVFIVLLGYSINNRITSADVSNQIQTEAPWNKDGPDIRRRLAALELQISQLQRQITLLTQKG